jgi:hypothetical protein
MISGSSSKAPQVTASAKAEKIEIDILQAEAVPGTAVVTL